MEHWEKIAAAQKMQNFIHENLKEPITLKMLASTVDYSPWYAAKIFKEILEKPPFEYIRAVRLSEAAAVIQKNDHKRIIDVAFDFVFDSHEGFTRAFTKEFGLSPRRYRESYPPVKMFIPQRAWDYYLRKQKGESDMTEKNNTVFIQVVERPKRKLILKRGIKASHYFEYCEEVGCDIWDILSGIKEALYEPIGLWLPENMRPEGTSVYAQGVEVSCDYSGSVPAGFEMIDLDPCKWMVFQGPPYDDAKFETAIGELWEVMKTYKPELYGFEWADEDAPRFQLAPMGYRGYIEGRPVRELKK